MNDMPMNEKPANGRKFARRLIPWVAVLAALLLAIPVAVVMLVWSGLADSYLRDVVIREVGKATGGRVELRGYARGSGVPQGGCERGASNPR